MFGILSANNVRCVLHRLGVYAKAETLLKEGRSPTQAVLHPGAFMREKMGIPPARRSLASRTESKLRRLLFVRRTTQKIG